MKQIPLLLRGDAGALYLAGKGGGICADNGKQGTGEWTGDSGGIGM